MTVAVCFPTGNTVEPKTALALATLARSTRVPLILSSMGTCYVSLNRSMLAQAALDAGADAILWIDADQTFPHDGLDRLLAHDLPYVGATYRSRKAPHPYMVPMLDKEFGPLVRVAYLPNGFSLVKREVYDAVGFPYYRADWGLNPAKPEDFEGEDIHFGRRAREAGFDIMCDMVLTEEIGHVIGIELLRDTHVPAIGG